MPPSLASGQRFSGSSYVYLREGAGWQPVGPNSFDVEVAADETKVIEFRVRRPKARK